MQASEPRAAPKRARSGRLGHVVPPALALVLGVDLGKGASFVSAPELLEDGDLRCRKARVPEIHEEDDSHAAAVVPDFLLERAVEHQDLARPPRALTPSHADA